MQNKVITMKIEEKQLKYQKYFDLLDDPLSQSEYLIQLGLKHKKEPELQTDYFRIEGCKTAIWIKTSENTPTVSFQCDSDSLLVKGILSIYEDLYQRCSQEQIQSHPPAFLEKISEDVIYPEIKRNGLLKCYKTIAHITSN